MHPILGDTRRQRVFALIWPVVGAALGVLPLWWAGGDLHDWWAVVVWGEVLAIPLLASAYIVRFAPIATTEVPQLFASIAAAALFTAAIWLGAGWLWLWAVSWAAPSAHAVFAADDGARGRRGGRVVRGHECHSLHRGRSR